MIGCPLSTLNVLIDWDHMAQPPHATRAAMPWTIRFPAPFIVYPIVTVFRSYVLDTNTWSDVASGAPYTLT